MMAPLNSGRQNQKKAEAGPWISSDGGLINPIIYHDPAIYEREMDAIFGRSWQFVGMASQIEEPGDFFLSRPLLHQAELLRGLIRPSACRCIRSPDSVPFLR